jgi:formyl-CoA transferase
VTGYGSTGPDRHLKAYDATIQAAVGLMSLTGLPGQPPMKAGATLSDAIAGTFAFAAILAALYDRTRTGKGQFVDVAMADCLFALLFDDPIDWYERLGVSVRQGNRIMRFSPMNTYRTSDGWAVLGAATDKQWLGVLSALGREDLKTDPHWMSTEWRISNNDLVDAMVGTWALGRTTERAVAIMLEAGAIAAKIRDPKDLRAWEHLKARHMYLDLDHPRLGRLEGVGAPGFPIKFSRASTGYDRPAPWPSSTTIPRKGTDQS